jgi:tetratricopeptide (TPR) repeat protein
VSLSLCGSNLALVAALTFGSAACGGKAAPPPVAADKGLPPANPVAVQRMVEGATAAKDPRMQTRAIALLREAVQIDPNLWEARFDLGVVLANSGDLGKAEQELTQAAKTAPDREEVAIALAEVKRRRGSPRDAALGLEAFVKDHPSALDAKTLLVTAYRESGQHDKAIAQARDVLAKKPGDANALADLALCHLGKGERETANLLVKQSLEVNAKSALAHRVQGLVALAEGDDASAFQAFSKAAQEDPTDTTSRVNMGSVLLKAGSYAKAAEQFKGALAATPDDSSAQIGLAAADRGLSAGKDQKMLDDAKALLSAVLEREPHNLAALFNMGILLSDSMKKPADAKPYFERFLDDAPKDHPARAEAEKQLAGGGAAPAGAPVAPAAPAKPTPAPAKPGGKK